MTRRLSQKKLKTVQKDLWLAELARESDDGLLITLAGATGVLAFDLQDLNSLAVAYECLDPWLLPQEMVLTRELELGEIVDFEPEEEISARLVELVADQFADLVASSQVTWLRGSSETASDAPYLFDLRVENWSDDPARCDLHILAAAGDFLAVGEEDEVDLAPSGDDGLKADSGGAAAHQAPDEPSWSVLPNDLPAELEAPLRAFFVAQGADDFAALTALWPNHDLGVEQQIIHLQRHFHSLEDWGYARMIEGWKQSGDIAAVRVRGISHSAPEAGVPALNEDCVWTFSLRRRGEGFIIRSWSRGWPAVGGAERLPAEAKPWLASWCGGPILDD